MAPESGNGTNGLVADPSVIDPAKWPQYLIEVLRSNIRKLSETNVRLDEVQASFAHLNVRMDEFELTFNGKVTEAVRNAMAEHMIYHAEHEKHWGFRAWVRENPWRFAIIVLFIGVALGFLFGIPIKEIFKMYKELRAAGLIK